MKTWFVIACCFLAMPVAAAETKPNIIFILADDFGWADLSCYGNTLHESPNIDRLAKQGMRFTNGYAACPVCSPTRASIMTGKYPARLQLTNYLKGVRQPKNSPILVAQYRDELPLAEQTLAEYLKAAGYATGHFGKWHLGGKDFAPEQQGFDAVINATRRGPAPGQTKAKADKMTEFLTDSAIDFIEQHKDQPFFCYLPFNTPHIPLEADATLIEKYRAKIAAANSAGKPHRNTNALYAAMIEEMDLHVGRLLAKLDELKLADNTLVVFTSDNGGLSAREGPHTPATTNAPLREGKGHVYEGGTRVAWIACQPGTIPAGTTCDVPVSSVDWLPTILDLANLERKTADSIDGVSIVPLLKQTGEPKRDAIFWHYPHYSNQGGKPGSAIRAGDWKLVELYETGKLELYNLKDDVGEQHDLAAKHPDKVKDLHTRLEQWRRDVNANLVTKNPNYDQQQPTVDSPK